MFHSARCPALIVVDMQNDFVRRGAPMEVPSSRDIVVRLQALISAFRARSLPVVFTRYVAAPDYRHLQTRLPWLELIEPPVSACLPGHMRGYADVDQDRDAAAMIDELAPEPRDIVIDKIFYSAFFKTNLHQQLQSLGVDALAVTGTLTEMCVEDTARHAVHHGYPTAMVRDAVASNSPTRHDAALDAFAGNYGWVMDASEIEARLMAPLTKETDG
ncbi:cysteine hydrolase [Roseovarius spongiae]|uniref:Cysteine hydrolase n=1 Tax=Roseovarius spongiae TaxID=2320272 RepID=A0A3A8ARN3_9RHOB|nr:cysteine hydrolase [Roseovarius spongiae]RKF12575.1 cysteine hydrolase [Roseovarius spongiae]